MKEYHFRVQGLPPSYNKHFKINYNYRNVYLTEKAKQFKQRVKMSMPALKLADDHYFLIAIEYVGQWFYKNKRPKRQDLQNLDKILLDAIFEMLGCDDSRLWFLTHRKIQNSDEEYTEVFIYPFLEPL